jgi:hypothetical protein
MESMAKNSLKKLVFSIWLILCGTCLLLACSNNKPFDSEAWLKGDRKVRGQMAHSLRDGRILEGKCQTEVIAVLGNPDGEYSEVLIYQVDLGHKFGSSPWLYQMNVAFEGGKVARVGLTD